jgi:hypothetical protein
MIELNFVACGDGKREVNCFSFSYTYDHTRVGGSMVALSLTLHFHETTRNWWNLGSCQRTIGEQDWRDNSGPTWKWEGSCWLAKQVNQQGSPIMYVRTCEIPVLISILYFETELWLGPVAVRTFPSCLCPCVFAKTPSDMLRITTSSGEDKRKTSVVIRFLFVACAAFLLPAAGRGWYSLLLSLEGLCVSLDCYFSHYNINYII